ncbi:hypothetical protein BBK82_26595 [Lentzea guizhouensis]|uniref:MalT-like TPR region domain-containing protein n=2 Tax=Lentzea guizhouensis TaxID=1586287 RepID=A0A1B2HN14_9PSEU|nr:hypothetical protein BBK82_26595 [Lentzea guizhouensis]
MLTDDARDNRGEDLRSKLKNFTYWAEYSAKHPEATNADMLADFVEDLSRIAGNYGALDEADVITALDHAIEMRQRDNGPTSALHRAKARYLSTLQLEHEGREPALVAALNDAEEGTAEWGDVVVDYTWLHLDVSRYDRAMEMIDRLRTAMPEDLFERKYRCAHLTMSAVALFTSFKDLRKSKELLEQACGYEANARNDLDLCRWLATAFHYRARIAEVQRDFAKAISLYLRGKELQDRCPEHLKSVGYIHLRLSEPLLAVGLLGPARQHLDAAYRMFLLSADHSSGRLQVELGFAALSAAEGDFGGAFDTVQRSRRKCRDVDFWRGELLCLGFQLALQVRRRQVSSILGTLIDILRTIRGGELGRNNVVRLFGKLPVVLPIVVRRMSSRLLREDGTKPAILSRCPCSLHEAGSDRQSPRKSRQDGLGIRGGRCPARRHLRL